ncbi:hypothetical protein [Schumannella luteola]
MLFGFVMLLLVAFAILRHRVIARLMVEVWRHFAPISDGEARGIRYFLLGVLCLMAAVLVVTLVLSMRGTE